MICCLSSLSLYDFVFCLDCLTFKQEKVSWNKLHQTISTLFQWSFGYQPATENSSN